MDEAASMDVLCSDKTGTLTQNALSVAKVQPMPGNDEAQVLMLASLASSDGGADPVDVAIRGAAALKPAHVKLALATFTPFDPDKKFSAATAADPSNTLQRIVKGSLLSGCGRCYGSACSSDPS